MTDWYDDAYKDFMRDGPLFSGVSTEDFQKVYAFLSNEGLIDYDTEKEYLFDQYVEEDEDD